MTKEMPVSEPETRFGNVLESIPFKKRRFLFPSPSPPPAIRDGSKKDSAISSARERDSNHPVKKHGGCVDFSGMTLLAAVACDTETLERERPDRNRENSLNLTEDSPGSLLIIPENRKGSLSRVGRLHWDLNKMMEEWEIPCSEEKLPEVDDLVLERENPGSKVENKEDDRIQAAEDGSSSEYEDGEFREASVQGWGIAGCDRERGDCGLEPENLESAAPPPDAPPEVGGVADPQADKKFVFRNCRWEEEEEYCGGGGERGEREYFHGTRHRVERSMKRESVAAPPPGLAKVLPAGRHRIDRRGGEQWVRRGYGWGGPRGGLDRVLRRHRRSLSPPPSDRISRRSVEPPFSGGGDRSSPAKPPLSGVRGTSSPVEPPFSDDVDRSSPVDPPFSAGGCDGRDLKKLLLRRQFGGGGEEFWRPSGKDGDALKGKLGRLRYRIRREEK